jgi:hypothetical protein
MDTTYDDLVLQFEQVESKDNTIKTLRAAGEDAKPALLRGVNHPSWRVRHCCLRVLDHTIVDDPTRLAIIKALDDPHRKVRKAALHVLGCEVCKPEGFCGIEGVDMDALYREKVLHDPSERVRRSAMGHFMWGPASDDVVVDVMSEVMTLEQSDDLRHRAASALARRS